MGSGINPGRLSWFHWSPCRFNQTPPWGPSPPHSGSCPHHGGGPDGGAGALLWPPPPASVPHNHPTARDGAISGLLASFVLSPSPSICLIALSVSSPSPDHCLPLLRVCPPSSAGSPRPRPPPFPRAHAFRPPRRLRRQATVIHLPPSSSTSDPYMLSVKDLSSPVEDVPLAPLSSTAEYHSSYSFSPSYPLSSPLSSAGSPPPLPTASPWFRVLLAAPSEVRYAQSVCAPPSQSVPIVPPPTSAE